MKPGTTSLYQKDLLLNHFPNWKGPLRER